MPVAIHARLQPVRAGWLARSPTLGLAGQGKSESDAIDSLKRAASAYLRGLRRAGILEEELRKIDVASSAADDTVIVSAD